MTNTLTNIKFLLPPPAFKASIAELPYSADSSTLFSPIQDQDWSIFLDSCHNNETTGNRRYDIIAWKPFLTLTCSGKTSTLMSADGTVLYQTSSALPLELLQTINSYYAAGSETLICANPLPFKGGAIGHFSYELMVDQTLSPLPHQFDDQQIDLAMGFYENFIIVDHWQKKTTLVCLGLTKRKREDRSLPSIEKWRNFFLAEQNLSPALAIDQDAHFKLLTPFISNMTADEYKHRFNKIIAYLKAGDCYQVNLAQRFTARFSGNPWHAYCALRAVSPAPFSAFLNLPHGKILSHSPESFLRVANNQVETRPIKGTQARKKQASEDIKQAELLTASSKDKAENLMIVDLMRNDISRNCVVGSVSVPKLFALESFSNVHHLVSTVQGTLAPGHSSIELLRDCFPGGSITGAPKRRAMEIIAELEPDARSAYCGSIGYIGFNGDMSTNIAIRTLQCQGQAIQVWGGGGIVADSNCDSEYQESIQKVDNLISALQAL